MYLFCSYGLPLALRVLHNVHERSSLQPKDHRCLLLRLYTMVAEPCAALNSHIEALARSHCSCNSFGKEGFNMTAIKKSTRNAYFCPSAAGRLSLLSQGALECPLETHKKRLQRRKRALTGPSGAGAAGGPGSTRRPRRGAWRCSRRGPRARCPARRRRSAWQPPRRASG